MRLDGAVHNHRLSTCASAASVSGNQNAMSMARYISIAVDTAACSPPSRTTARCVSLPLEPCALLARGNPGPLLHRVPRPSCRAVTRGHGPPCCHGASLPCAPALPSALAFFLQRGTVASVVRGAVQRGRLPAPSQAMAGSTPCDAAAPGSARGLPRSVWRPALPTMRPLPPDGGEPRPRKTVIMKEHA